jgi:hypothetical protein
MTFILSGFIKYLDLTFVGLYTTSGIVLALWNLISSGITSSSLNNSLNGVKLVALEMDVLWF